MARRNRIIFTNHEQSDKGVMSLVLGVLCVLSLIYSLVYSYIKQGEVRDNFGTALFVTLVLSVTGLILGALSRSEADTLKAIPTIGTILNILVIVALGALLWIGLN